MSIQNALQHFPLHPETFEKCFPLKLHFVQNVEPDIPPVAGGNRGRFANVSPFILTTFSFIEYNFKLLPYKW
jgi:hypothetical protein